MRTFVSGKAIGWEGGATSTRPRYCIQLHLLFYFFFFFCYLFFYRPRYSGVNVEWSLSGVSSIKVSANTFSLTVSNGWAIGIRWPLAAGDSTFYLFILIFFFFTCHLSSLCGIQQYPVGITSNKRNINKNKRVLFESFNGLHVFTARVVW